MFIYSSRIFFSSENEPGDARKEDLKSCVVTIADIMEEMHPPSVHWTDEESLSHLSDDDSSTLTFNIIYADQEEVVARVQAKAED